MIAGTGRPALLQALREQAASAGLADSVALRFGFIAPEQLPLYHHAADILVYPYKGGTTSGALMTGMQYGKPIVASALPMFCELLTQGRNALLVPPGEPRALAAALGRLLGDPALRTALGSAVREKARSLSGWEAIAVSTNACYRELTGLNEAFDGAQGRQENTRLA